MNEDPLAPVQPRESAPNGRTHKSKHAMTGIYLGIALLFFTFILLKPYNYGVAAWLGFGIFGMLVSIPSVILGVQSLKKGESRKLGIASIAIAVIPFALGSLGVIYAIIMTLVTAQAAS